MVSLVSLEFNMYGYIDPVPPPCIVQYCKLDKNQHLFQSIFNLKKLHSFQISNTKVLQLFYDLKAGSI